LVPHPYRAKAYLKAAESLGALSQPLDRIIKAGTLIDIPGIVDAIADIITKLHETGSHPSLEKLRKEVPDGVLELFAILGIRPDKILKLHHELGISSLTELEAAAKEDPICSVGGGRRAARPNEIVTRNADPFPSGAGTKCYDVD
jgi:DNA polymerase (family 10)